MGQHVPVHSNLSICAVTRIPLWEHAGLCLLAHQGLTLTSPEMHMAPADWPNRVTLFGSPPKALMFSCTQRRAASWSSSAQFPWA